MKNLTQQRVASGIRPFRLAFLVLPVLCTEPVTASTSYETSARVYDSFGPRTVCNDFFCQSTTVIPPDDMTERHSGIEEHPEAGPLVVNSDASVVIGLASASASTRLNDPGHRAPVVGAPDADYSQPIKFGASASALRSGYHLGEAVAQHQLKFRLHVELEFEEGAFVGQLTAALCTLGCPLAVNFQHQTTGLFGFSGVPGQGAEARFAETLRISGGAEVAGEAFIAADPSGSNAVLSGATGAWSENDFYAPTPTDSGSPWGTGTQYLFNHFETIYDQIAMFGLLGETCLGNRTGFLDYCLSGVYDITLTQTASAGFGGHSEYTTGGGVYADFAHTSEFSPISVFDPSGQLDLSEARISIYHLEPAPVPLPNAIWLLASALGLFGLKQGRHAPVAGGNAASRSGNA